ncbi:aminoglycoside phosphotransferase family protein [Janthinobacterium sp. FT14W]|uniref:aminoglycoside phosphotransferase family protein n=1 Tax=Janthinobacterium sp. FT14W TaxID=2654253 RepID=UPI0029C9E880|nr:aminoglycoside phosphotransferase family protein [Janthinobacterium sp. FT14W]
MLKLSTGDDERRAGVVLRWWDGDAAVCVLAASTDGDALLLERARDTRSLAALARTGEEGDAAATAILCAVASRLHAPRPVAPGRLQRQVALIADAAGLERARLLAWCAAWAGLSAAWHIEDGTPPETALAVADMALEALQA